MSAPESSSSSTSTSSSSTTSSASSSSVPNVSHDEKKQSVAQQQQQQQPPVTSSHTADDDEDQDASYLNPSEVASSISIAQGGATADDVDDDVPPNDDDLADVQVDDEEDVDVGEGEGGITMMSSSAAHEAAQVLANDDSVQGFFEHKEAVFCVGTHGDWVVSGDGNDQAYVWNRTDGEIKYHLSGHTDSVISCDFSYDEKMVATASMDGTVRVYNMADGGLVHSLEGPGAELEWFQWHHQGHVILAGSADHTTWMWNATSGQLMQMFTGHTGSVLAGGFSHDGKVVVTASEDGSVFIWSPKSGKPVLHVTDAHEAPICALAQHPSQRLILTGGVDASVALISAESGKILSQFKGHTDSIEGAGFSSVLRYAATGSVDGQLKIWDLGTSQARTTAPHPDAITHLIWHPTDPLVFTSCCDRLIRMWDARSGKAERQWAGHQDNILTFRLTSDNRQIVSGGDDKTVLVFTI